MYCLIVLFTSQFFKMSEMEVFLDEEDAKEEKKIRDDYDEDEDDDEDDDDDNHLMFDKLDTDDEDAVCCYN